MYILFNEDMRSKTIFMCFATVIEHAYSHSSDIKPMHGLVRYSPMTSMRTWDSAPSQSHSTLASKLPIPLPSNESLLPRPLLLTLNQPDVVLRMCLTTKSSVHWRSILFALVSIVKPTTRQLEPPFPFQSTTPQSTYLYPFSTYAAAAA
jgi:hypothetical protein